MSDDEKLCGSCGREACGGFPLGNPRVNHCERWMPKQDRQRWAGEWKRDIHNAITAMGNLIGEGVGVLMRREMLHLVEDVCQRKIDEAAESDQPLPDLTNEDWRKE